MLLNQNNIKIKSKPPVQRVVCSEAVSLCYLPAPKTLAFIFFKPQYICRLDMPQIGLFSFTLFKRILVLFYAKFI